MQMHLRLLPDFVLLFQLPSFAQMGDAVVEESTGNVVEDDLKYLYDDAKEIFSSPSNFGPDSWLDVATILGATVLAYSADEYVRSYTQSIRTESSDEWLKGGDIYGRPEAGTTIGALTYITGLLADNDHTRVTGRMVFQAVAYSGIVTSLIKFILGRSRPFTDNGARDFRFLKLDNPFLSHPSGHTTVAFSVSSVLSRRIDNIYASIGLYGLASLTAVQRIFSDNHWLSDTILGGSIGALIGIAVVRIGEERNANIFDDQGPVSAQNSPHLPLVGYSIGF